MSDNESYERFFSEVGAYLLKEKERKKIDNDYNPLLVIRSQSDEVKLHSRIIHSLLDTRGKHYQGSLFLEPFLKMLDFKDFALDLHRAFVMREYKHIDLYISDNDKHIIIENKIYAGDGDKQIERYIDSLIKDGADCENIAVVYLSVESQKISPYSLGKWKNDKGYLVCGDKKIRYKNITYSNEILSWIESCQSKAKNITNLYATLEFYKKCVENITKGEKMGLEKFLKENMGNANYTNIIAEIQKIKLEEMICKVFKEDFESKAEFSEWQFFSGNEIKGFEIGGYKRIFAYGNKKHLSQTFKFMLTLEKTRFNNAYIGFSLFVNGESGGKSYNHFCGFKDKNIPKALKLIIEKQTNFKLTDSGWWVIDDNGRYDVDLQNDTLSAYFMRMYQKVNSLNDFLQNDSGIAKLASEVK